MGQGCKDRGHQAAVRQLRTFPVCPKDRLTSTDMLLMRQTACVRRSLAGRIGGGTWE